MRATTVRFGSDLWEMLEREAARSGVSVAQYVREAALTRIAYSAGRRGDDPFDTAPKSEPALQIDELAEGAEAVKAQAAQAVRRAEQLVQRAKSQDSPRQRSGRRPPRTS